MSDNERARVHNAINIIRDASVRLLRPYKNELSTALRRIDEYARSSRAEYSSQPSPQSPVQSNYRVLGTNRQLRSVNRQSTVLQRSNSEQLGSPINNVPASSSNTRDSGVLSLHSECASRRSEYSRQLLSPSSSPSVPGRNTPSSHSDQQSPLETPRSTISQRSQNSCQPSTRSRQLSFEEVFRRLQRTLQDIKHNLYRIHEMGFLEPSWVDDDPRVVDIQIANSDSTLVQRFRRGLSQRSLALQFDSWEKTTYQKSTIDERMKDLRFKHRVIKQFLDCSHIKDKDIAHMGIRHGIKLLICERLLGGAGYTAILIFKYRDMHYLRYEHLHEFVHAIQSSKAIVEVANQQAQLLNQYQSDYEGRRPLTPEA
ncbi:MAG: hypothetical protein LQ351_007978 [Letrouitia transgressa]|nr:MAG: hypothetical protein LQ351_007978 [Letrouitia transgressa]